MSPQYHRALTRLAICERNLSDFDRYRKAGDEAQDRLLRKLVRDVEDAEAAVRWAENHE
jgi:hypothetical protein